MTIAYPNKYEEKIIGGALTTYYFLGNRLVADLNGTTLEFVHQDHLGSTAATTNSTDALKSKTSCYPFGATRPGATGTLGTAIQFTGQRLGTTGLYFYNSRYYDPTIGRFISPDMMGVNPQSLNRYSYVANRPTVYNDPRPLTLFRLDVLADQGLKVPGHPSGDPFRRRDDGRFEGAVARARPGRDFGDHAREYRLRLRRVLGEVADDHLHRYGLVVWVPAIVVRGAGEHRVAHLGLTGQLGFGERRHADDAGTPGAVELRFGDGRELRALHGDVRPATMHPQPLAFDVLGEQWR